MGSSYVLDELLGTGASGQVWSGRDAGGQTWAFKLLRAELAADPGIVNRFVQERTVLASIRHPNVVQVHDLVVEGATLAIVMDLVQGQDLRSLLRHEGTLPPERVAVLGAQMASALQAAHRTGVVHRDVKPENVLIDAETGDARLTDFGIARLVDGSQRSTMLLGTPQYMAPEVAEGKPPTPAVDVYSLGIMLYELCCGVPPFAGRGSAMATLRGHAMETPGRPEGVPDRLWDAITSLTAKEPAQRPSAESAAAELAAAAQELVGVGAAPRLTQPPPGQPVVGSTVGPGGASPTVLGAAAAGTPGAGDTMFVERGRTTPGWGPAAGAFGPGGYVHPAASGFSTGGFPGGYPSGGYPSGGYPSGYPSPTGRGSKRRGALAGAVVGVLLAMVVGLGWLALERSSQSSSTAVAATTPTPTRTASAAPGKASTPRETTTVEKEVVRQAPAPRVTVTRDVPTTSEDSASEDTSSDSSSSETADESSRRDAADQLVRSYRSSVSGLSRGDMATFFAPTVQWYGISSISRESLWSRIKEAQSDSSTSFSPMEYHDFVSNVNYKGQTADRIEYSVSYSKRNSQGEVTKTGTVIVCYVLVDVESGNPRIARVYER